ncbi:YceI family protein [bacterium]|nr:YceI family protein [candidate division CSSED10-310 bacterium]
MKVWIVISFIVLAMLSMVSPGQATEPVEWTIDTYHSNIGFSVRHLMISNVKGGFSEFRGTVMVEPETGKLVSVVGEVDVKTVDTGIKKRDEHLLQDEFFNAEKYPKLTFRSTKIEWDGDAVTLTGDLTIRDITKEVEAKGVFHGVQTVDMGYGLMQYAGYTFTGAINRKDFNLNFAKIVNGVAVVDDVVNITIEVEINHKAE